MTPLKVALVQMTTARMIALVATVVGFAILARLLEPATFGHYAIAFSIYNLMKALSNFGMRQYIIRAEGEIDSETASAAASLSLWIASLGCLACIAAAIGLRGWLLADATADALVPLGVALLAGPFSLNVEAQLHRGMAFGVPARAEAASSVAEVAAGIALALAGFGALALALGALTAQVVLAAMLVLGGAQATRVWPRLRRLRIDGIARLGKFGGRLSVINFLPSAADIVLVWTLSALAGPVVTGTYNRALVIRDLLDRTLLEGISPVILPALSSALRQGMAPSAVLATKLDYLTVICWPAFAIIALLAEPLVALLLGPQWSDAVPAVRILAVGGLAVPFTKMSVKFFTAIDALDAYLLIQAGHQAMLLAFGVIGAAISLEAFCAAISAALILKAAWILLWLHARSERVRGQRNGHNGHNGRAMARGAFVTAATVAAPAGVIYFAGSDILGALLAAVLAGIGWLLAMWACKHPLLRDIGSAAMVLAAIPLPRRRR